MSKQIITINRMFGSNGRVIGKAIADALGLKFYDKELIEIASREKGVPFDEFAKADEKKASQWRYSVEYDIQIDREYHFTPINDVLFVCPEGDHPESGRQRRLRDRWPLCQLYPEGQSTQSLHLCSF